MSAFSLAGSSFHFVWVFSYPITSGSPSRFIFLRVSRTDISAMSHTLLGHCYVDVFFSFFFPFSYSRRSGWANLYYVSCCLLLLLLRRGFNNFIVFIIYRLCDFWWECCCCMFYNIVGCAVLAGDGWDHTGCKGKNSEIGVFFSVSIHSPSKFQWSWLMGYFFSRDFINFSFLSCTCIFPSRCFPPFSYLYFLCQDVMLFFILFSYVTREYTIYIYIAYIYIVWLLDPLRYQYQMANSQQLYWDLSVSQIFSRALQTSVRRYRISRLTYYFIAFTKSLCYLLSE